MAYEYYTICYDVYLYVAEYINIIILHSIWFTICPRKQKRRRKNHLGFTFFRTFEILVNITWLFLSAGRNSRIMHLARLLYLDWVQLIYIVLGSGNFHLENIARMPMNVIWTITLRHLDRPRRESTKRCDIYRFLVNALFSLNYVNVHERKTVHARLLDIADSSILNWLDCNQQLWGMWEGDKLMRSNG